ncbi:TPA: restriction endonuclease subunit S [Escherichia coli]
MVPKGWSSVQAQDVCKSISVGVVIKPTQYYVPEGYGVKAFRSANVREGFINDSDWVYFSHEGHAINKKSHLKTGDVLIVRTGYPGTACVVTPEFEGSNAIDIVIARPDMDKIIPEYLCAYTNSHIGKSQVLDLQGGMAQKHLNVGAYQVLKINLPPLREQKKIAQILLTWDNAISVTENLLANSQQQKKALMQQLLTGKRRFGWEGGYAYSVPQGYAKSKLGALPSAWKVDLLEKHLWFQEGPGVRNHQFTETGIKLFNGTNIQFNKIDLTNTTTHISSEEAFGIYKHFLIDEGDLLIACSGISVNRFNEKIAFALSSHLPLCMNTSTMRFKVLDNHILDIRYFQYFMQSLLFKNQIRRQATGSAQLNFGPSHVGKCFVVIPSIEEQQKIAAVLSAADAETSTLEKKLACLKDEKKALMQQLLTGKRRVKVEAEEAVSA